MGAVIGVAIVTCVLNSYVESRLSTILPPNQINMVLQSSAMVEKLPQELRNEVRFIFGKAYNIQMTILIGFSGAQIPAALLMWQKKQVVLGI